MAGLKEVRLRITSVESTKQITNAMKMVSASKLRRAQNAIVKLRPYEAKLQEILHHIQSKVKDMPQGIFSQEREIKRVLLIVITSNKGLCGNFNSTVIKETVASINNNYASFKAAGTLDIITIGRKGTEYFRKRNYNVVADYDELFQKLTYETTEPVVRMIMEKFSEGTYDAVDFIYNRFKNASVQILTNERFLPVPVAPEKVSAKREKSDVDYLYEPGKEEIISELIPKTLKLKFHRALLDSFAAEHGARMTAMHKATDNATELIKALKLHYNKVRQATITKEILEIVGGAEALKG